MNRQITISVIVLCLFSLAGCSNSTGPDLETLTPEIAERIAGPVSFMAFAVANGPEGSSFLDNFMPSVRRGIAHYVNTPVGRSVTFNGCDLGDGIVLDGSGELIWVGPDLATTRDRFCTIDSCASGFQWRGSLLATLDGKSTVAINNFDVTDIQTVFDTRAIPVAATVTLGGVDISVADEDLYLKLFDTSGMDIESIPNPSNSLGGLRRPDLQRLAYHGGMYLAWLLINESLDVRPDHTHEEACGTTTVTFDEDGFAHMTSAWSECPERGLFLTGDFSMELDPTETDFGLPILQMNVTGDLKIGGGVPTVLLSAWQWRVEFPDGFSGMMDISMVLQGPNPGDRREFTETVPVDD